MKYLLSNIFGRSPITSIQEHLSVAHQCATQLEPLFQAAFKENWDEVSNLQQTITKLENKADKIKKQVRLSLPASLFLPVPRNDLLEIITIQDKVANRAKDIAGIVLGRRMLFPITIQSDFIAFITLSIAASEQALRAVDELDNLLEAGFRGREVVLVEQLIEKLSQIETETDKDQVLIRQKMLNIEDDLKPINAIFIYKIIDWIGDVADRASRVGNHLLLLLAR